MSAIRSMEVPEPEPEEGFVIETRWNWFDLKAILNSDVTPYAYRVAEMIYSSFNTTEITISGTIAAVRTSDGAFYTSSATHTWDPSQDRQIYLVQDDGTVLEQSKARYLIKYYSTENITLTLLHECFYFVIDRAKFSTSGFGNSSLVNAKKSLIYFDLINGADLQSSVTTISSMFYQCLALVGLPLFNTTNVTNFASAFYYCYSLKHLPRFDTSKVTNFTNSFYGCESLQRLPSFDLSSASIFTSAFYQCRSLRALPVMSSSSITTIASMCQYCYSLTTAPQINLTNATTTMSASFTYCYNLVTANLSGLRANASISIDPYLLSRESIIYIIQNRNLDIAGTITLTIGPVNIEKLTDDEKALAAANRITLA